MEEQVFVCEEMKKLRKMLDDRGIEWQDTSRPGDIWVCQTRVDIGRKHYSIINGVGSYGGFSMLSGKNYGLLEVWDFTRENEPIGSLTAEQVLQHIEAHTKK